jgi:uncharacterized protein (DUF58 family)
MTADWESTRMLLRRLHWAVVRPLATRLNGDERSKRAGPGVEFAGVREYQPGDDVRRIDWNLTARADRAFVREAHAERALDVWLVVDVSASVDWGTAECLKRYRAIELAAITGQLVGHHGNRLGLLLFAEHPLDVEPPGAGHGHLERVVGRLRLEPRRAARGATDLTAALRSIDLLARRPSLIVLVSDFLVKDGWIVALRQLAYRHEIVAARLSDPRETGLPDIGVVTFEDPETAEQLTVDTGDPGLRKRFNAAATAQSQRIDAALSACDVDHFTLSTDTSILPTLAAFVDLRRRMGSRRPTHRPMKTWGGAPTATPSGAVGVRP